MRRVLYLDHSPEIIGGGQISLLALMQHLDHRQYSPLCACPPGGSLAAAARQKGIEVREVEMPPLRLGAVLPAMRAMMRLCWLVRREWIALIHANGSRCMFYAGVAGKLARVPVVWHVRVSESDGWWDRVLAWLATRIIAISRAVASRLAFLATGEKLCLIYNGVDVQLYAQADGTVLRRSLGYGDRPLVGMVGRLTPEKDHETYLRAAALVAARWPRARFLIVGEDPEPQQQRRRTLEALAAESGLAGKVIFTGPRQDIPQVLAALDVLVHCAHREAFGRVLVEAMATGKPVVATRVGGIPEVVEDGQTGVLVNRGDAGGIARAIEGLIGDPATARALGEAGQRRAQERFSIVAHVARVEALYGELLGEGV